MKRPFLIHGNIRLKLGFSLIILSCFIETLVAQTYENYIPKSSPKISFESSVSTIWLNEENTSLLGGFALHNYWYLKSIGDNQNSFLGLDIPLRFIVIDEDEGSGNDDILNYKDQFSLALLIRWDRYLTGNKRKLGLFIGAGPEFRSSIKSNGYMFVPFVQQELGINWQFASLTNSLLKNHDLGFAFSLPLRQEERKLSMMIGSIFYRFSI